MNGKNKKVGKQTIKLENPPKIISTYSIVGPKEGDGPLKDYFHQILNDDTLGKDSFEKAESEMMYTAIKSAISNANLREENIDYLFALTKTLEEDYKEILKKNKHTKIKLVPNM